VTEVRVVMDTVLNIAAPKMEWKFLNSLGTVSFWSWLLLYGVSWLGHVYFRYSNDARSCVTFSNIPEARTV